MQRQYEAINTTLHYIALSMRMHACIWVVGLGSARCSVLPGQGRLRGRLPAPPTPAGSQRHRAELAGAIELQRDIHASLGLVLVLALIRLVLVLVLVLIHLQ